MVSKFAAEAKKKDDTLWIYYTVGMKHRLYIHMHFDY